jgi:hypothetical protein
MIETTEDILKAILALDRANPHAYMRFMDWLNCSLRDQSSKAIGEKDEVELRWAQGRLQVMAELINIFNNVNLKLEEKSMRPDEFNTNLVID